MNVNVGTACLIVMAVCVAAYIALVLHDTFTPERTARLRWQQADRKIDGIFGTAHSHMKATARQHGSASLDWW